MLDQSVAMLFCVVLLTDKPQITLSPLKPSLHEAIDTDVLSSKALQEALLPFAGN